MALPAKKLTVTVDEYLKSEKLSPVRREFVDGQLFSMAGASESHNIIAGNLFALLRSHLQGTGCRAFISDVKVRVDASNTFYYPDVMISCEPFDARSVFKKAPILIAEVLSPSTVTIDRREKLVAYKQMKSLKEYIVISQESQLVEVYFRDSADAWELREYQPPDEIVVTSMPAKVVRLAFGEIYEGVVFAPL